MSELDAATTTETAARLTDPEAVMELCSEYILDPLQWEIDRDGRFSLRGYGDLDVFVAEVDEDHGERYIDYDAGLRTREFLQRLSQYIAEGEELDLRMVGFKKLQEVAAQRYVIRPDEILYGDLEGVTPLPDDQQPGAKIAVGD